MKIKAVVEGRTITVPVGRGDHNIRWLAVLVAFRARQTFYPYVFRPPMLVMCLDGQMLTPRARINTSLKDGDTIEVQLSIVSDESREQTSRGQPSWRDLAFGKSAHLCAVKIEWVTRGAVSQMIPAKVMGEIEPLVDLKPLYRITGDVVSFEAPLKPVERGDGTFSWMCDLAGPPGIARFVFVNPDGSSVLSDFLTIDNGRHKLTIDPDIPVVNKQKPCACDDEYSERFLSDWSELILPRSIKAREEELKRKLFNFYPKLCVIYTLISLFRSPRSVTVDDLSYVMKANLARGESYSTKISRSQMIGSVIEILHKNNGDADIAESIAVELEKIESNSEYIFMKKSLINSPLFPRAILKLQKIFGHQMNYLTTIDNMLRAAGGSVDQLITRISHHEY
jgi:hypothetical protein